MRLILPSPQTLGYALLRMAIGTSMLVHGVARLPKIAAFAAQTVNMFERSPLPTWAVDAFARFTPFAELAIGLSVLLGAATIWGLAFGGVWMVLLIFGCTLIEKYDIVGIQLIYSLIFFQLLLNHELNTLSLDAWIFRARRQP